MATPLNRLSIGQRLVLMTTGALLVFAVAGGYAVRASLGALERTHGELLVETADVMLGQMGALVAGRMDQLVRAGQVDAVQRALTAANHLGVRAAPDPRSGLGAAASKALRESVIAFDKRVFGRTVFDSVVVTDRSGRIVAATDPAAGPGNRDAAAWWHEARDKGRHVSGVVATSAGATPGLVVAVRIDDRNGRILGVAQATLSAAWITREAAVATQFRHPAAIRLTTRDGRLIFSRRPFRFLERVDDTPYFRAATQPRGFTTLAEAGRTRIVAHATNTNAPAIGSLGWTLFVAADRDVVLRDTHALQRRMLFVLAGMMVMAAALTVLLHLSLVRPLTGLRNAARVMAAGDLSVRVAPEGRDELADLGAAFNGMADQIEARNAELRRHAVTDALTGLRNRRGFMERGQAEWERCRRYRRPLTAVTLDIDHFKAVNDTHGHDAGDAVLQQVAGLCAGGVRTSDLVGRMGGEEFSMVLPETRLDAAMVLAERLRATVADASCGVTQPPIRVTVSLGVAEATADDASFEALLKRADDALYAAKRGGRNRIELAASQGGP